MNLERVTRLLSLTVTYLSFVKLSYQEAVAIPTMQDKGPRSALNQIVDVEEMKPLAIALTRIIAAKPHSADVEAD